MSLLDPLLPRPLPSSREERLRVRLAVGMALATAAACAVFVPINLLRAHVALMSVYAGGTLLALGGLVWLKRGGAPRVVIHTLAAIVSAILVGTCVVHGRAHGATLIYFSVIALGLLLLSGARAGLTWLGVGLVLTSVLFALEALALLPPSSVEPSRLSDYANVVVPATLVTFFAYHFARSKDRALAELDRANRELQEARARAESASRAKGEFLATMTHELRTPLNGVIGLAGVLLDGKLDDEQREIVNIMRRSGEALLGIIDDLLDLERLDAGRAEIDLDDVDPRALATFLRGVMVLRAQEKGLTLALHVDPALPERVRVDSGRLGQVLMNLVGNAIKFTEQGRIDVRFSSVPEGLRVEVQDTGPGIDDALKHKLFQPFTQGDSSMARRHGGAGLGLSICKRLVVAMSGEIGFESKVGVGSTFFFTVPIGAAARKRPTLAGPMRALIVDDNPVNVHVTRHMLQRLHVECDVAHDGQTALAALERERFDVVFMDVQLPGIDGLEVTRRLRARTDAASRVPVVAMTASARPGDREACLAAGMDDYLQKPVVPEDLERTLARARALAQPSSARPELNVSL